MKLFASHKADGDDGGQEESFRQRLIAIAAGVLFLIATTPLEALVGVLAAFKLFWAVGAVASVWTWKNAEGATARNILACMLVPLALVPLAVDTSRFAGFGFLGLLVALQYVVERNVLKPRTLTMLSIANLILLSVYAGLNSGVMMFPGLYRVVYGWLI